MYYYPIKPNDSKPNPNPIFIMNAWLCVLIIFNVATPDCLLKWWSRTWDTMKGELIVEITKKKLLNNHVITESLLCLLLPTPIDK